MDKTIEAVILRAFCNQYNAHLMEYRTCGVMVYIIEIA